MLDELNELESALTRNKDARLRVVRLRRRRLDEAPSVRLSVAGKLLDLSLPTIRAWIERGLLDEVDGSSPRRITLGSVLEVRPLVRELRALGRDRNLLEAVLARLDDERTLSDRKLRRSPRLFGQHDLIASAPDFHMVADCQVEFLCPRRHAAIGSRRVSGYHWGRDDSRESACGSGSSARGAG